MINEAIARLQQVGTFKQVQAVENLQPIRDLSVLSPGLIVYRGKSHFAPTPACNLVRQNSVKELLVILICKATEVEQLENRVIETLLGFQYTDYYTPMEVVESDNHDIQGFYCARRIIFKTEVQVRQPG